MRKSLAVAVVLLSAAGRAQALTININPVAGGALDPNAGSGVYNAAAAMAFQTAANDLAGRFTDNITVNVSANLTASGFTNPNVIGQTSSVQLVTAYTDVRTALIADGAANPANNTAAVTAALPASAPTFTRPAGGTGSNGYTYTFANSGNISGTKADLKALGYTGLDTQFGANDGTITFNSNFAFNYTGNPSSSQIDFRTTAEHELIHLLGFNSTTDTADNVMAAAAGGALTANTTVNLSPSVLDLYRFNAANVPTTLAAFTANPRDLVPGSNDFTSDSTTQLRMSTGAFAGDGFQASHWKADDLTGITLGIMDPTESYGQTTAVSGNDVRALELLGFDAVAAPEPTSLVLLAAAAVPALGRRRRAGVAGV